MFCVLLTGAVHLVAILFVRALQNRSQGLALLQVFAAHPLYFAFSQRACNWNVYGEVGLGKRATIKKSAKMQSTAGVTSQLGEKAYIMDSMENKSSLPSTILGVRDLRNVVEN